MACKFTRVFLLNHTKGSYIYKHNIVEISFNSNINKFQTCRTSIPPPMAESVSLPTLLNKYPANLKKQKENTHIKKNLVMHNIFIQKDSVGYFTFALGTALAFWSSVTYDQCLLSALF